MSKDNQDKILKSSLSTLLKRFSNTDVVSALGKEYSITAPSNIPLERISDNSVLKKARVYENKLNRTIESLKEKGFTSPLYIIQKDDHYEVIYPRITYIASKKLKLDTIPCVLLNMSEEDMLMFLASRILKDKDKNVIEMSLVFNHIQKKYKYEQKDIASAMHLSRSQVTNIMRLTKMPDSVLREIADGKLSFGHVRALSTLSEEQINELVLRIHNENLSVRDIEKIVYELKHKTSFIKEETKLSKKYNCHVNSLPKRVTFTFSSEEEKEKFINKISNK